MPVMSELINVVKGYSSCQLPVSRFKRFQNRFFSLEILVNPKAKKGHGIALCIYKSCELFLAQMAFYMNGPDDSLIVDASDRADMLLIGRNGVKTANVQGPRRATTGIRPGRNFLSNDDVVIQLCRFPKLESGLYIALYIRWHIPTNECNRHAVSVGVFSVLWCCWLETNIFTPGCHSWIPSRLGHVHIHSAEIVSYALSSILLSAPLIALR